jgi:hypothetical protein
LMMGTSADSVMGVVQECLRDPMEACVRGVYK